jgi:hypothetical protein
VRNNFKGGESFENGSENFSQQGKIGCQEGHIQAGININALHVNQKKDPAATAALSPACHVELDNTGDNQINSTTFKACETDLKLPSCGLETRTIFLEKIKEGMAQLLADYTWPWYEENFQLFKSLYNVHLINDVDSTNKASKVSKC